MKRATRVPKAKRAAAAFYDLDGTLVKTNLVHALFFQARNQQGILRSIKKTASVFASIPAFLLTDAYSRTAFQEMFFRAYKGESEDRIRFLSEELFEDVLRPSIYPGAIELIEKSKSLGLRQVLVTGALDTTVAPLARHLKIDDWITNRLEYVDGFASGRLLPPIMANATKASWIRSYAEKEGLSLTDSYCYTDSISDLPMLSVVGHPTVVHPDFRLRSTAIASNWPILDLQ
jgi:HAD superfamily hydrolase (TIGR01490 family)